MRNTMLTFPLREPVQQSGARHSNSSSTGHCCRWRKPNQHCRHCSSYRHARATAGRPTHRSNRTRHAIVLPKSFIYKFVHKLANKNLLENLGVLPLFSSASLRYANENSPRFLPDPASRGAPAQAEYDGATLPPAQTKPAEPPWYKAPPRQGDRRPPDPPAE